MTILTRLQYLAVFRKQLEENRARLRRTAFSWCQDDALADDLVQDTLTKAFKNLGQLREIAALRAWLFDILTNTWRDHLRRRRHLEDIDTLIEEQEPALTIACSEEQNEIIARVRSAVGGLPAWQREVLALVDLEGFSYAETAKLLGVPEGTIRSRVCRAREALRKLLVDMDDRSRQSAPLRRLK